MGTYTCTFEKGAGRPGRAGRPCDPSAALQSAEAGSISAKLGFSRIKMAAINKYDLGNERQAGITVSTAGPVE